MHIFWGGDCGYRSVFCCNTVRKCKYCHLSTLPLYFCKCSKLAWYEMYSHFLQQMNTAKKRALFCKKKYCQEMLCLLFTRKCRPTLRQKIWHGKHIFAISTELTEYNQNTFATNYSSFKDVHIRVNIIYVCDRPDFLLHLRSWQNTLKIHLVLITVWSRFLSYLYDKYLINTLLIVS